MSALLRPPSQVRAIALIALLGPPTASLILLAIDYVEYWRAVPLNLADFLVFFFLLAIPVEYAFGAVLAVSLYRAFMTVGSRLLRPRLAMRARAAAVYGGLASCLWFREWLSAWGSYGVVGALVVAAPSLGVESRIKQVKE